MFFEQELHTQDHFTKFIYSIISISIYLEKDMERLGSGDASPALLQLNSGRPSLFDIIPNGRLAGSGGYNIQLRTALVGSACQKPSQVSLLQH